MKRGTSTFLGFYAVLAIACLFQLSPTAERLSNRLLDGQFNFLRAYGQKPLKDEVVIVGIDNISFELFREPLALWHRHLGAFLAAMSAAEPRVLVLDVVLPDRSYEFLALGYDKPLLAGLLALRGEGSLVLAQTVNEEGRLRRLFPPIVAMAGQDSLGLALVEPDTDSIVRRVASRLETEKGQFTTLFGRALERLGMPAASGLIDYAVGEPFAYVPLQEVLAAHDSGQQERLKEMFAGRHVFVGAVLPFSDRHRVPVPLAGWEPHNRLVPGVLVHAQALRSALAGALIQPIQTSVIFLLIVTASLLWWICGSVYRGALASLAGIGVAWGGATWLLSNGIQLPVSAIGFTIVLAFAGRLSLEGALAYLERRRLRLSFGRYVSPNVLEEILSGRIKPGVGGERRHLCVLFSDIRSFTTRSETQPPEMIIKLLNDYFEEMTASVHRYGGTIDKFIGDGLMAFFGAPSPRENAVQDAFDAARDMLQRLVVLNERLQAESIEPIRIGVGLDAGEVVVGHVGSKQRHEYTVIGDTVNTASRLEGLTKELGYPVIVSAGAVDMLDNKDRLVDLGKQAVKGRAPVPVFGWSPPVKPA
jgi:class 3 adenylate cyclase